MPTSTLIDPNVQAATWLYGVLHADAALTALVGNRIYDTLPPEATSTASSAPVLYPVIVMFSMQDMKPLRAMGNNTVWSAGHWTVKCIDQSESKATARDVNNRCIQLLDNQSGSIGAGQMFFCQAQSFIDYPEVDSGKVYRHLGATYQMMVR